MDINRRERRRMMASVIGREILSLLFEDGGGVRVGTFCLEGGGAFEPAFPDKVAAAIVGEFLDGPFFDTHPGGGCGEGNGASEGAEGGAVDGDGEGIGIDGGRGPGGVDGSPAGTGRAGDGELWVRGQSKAMGGGGDNSRGGFADSGDAYFYSRAGAVGTGDVRLGKAYRDELVGAVIVEDLLVADRGRAFGDGDCLTICGEDIERKDRARGVVGESDDGGQDNY